MVPSKAIRDLRGCTRMRTRLVQVSFVASKLTTLSAQDIAGFVVLGATR